MKKILFIYGYGGSPQSKFRQLISEQLPQVQFEMLCVEYPQQDCAAALTTLMNVIEREHIDLVMGTSLGGFIALSLPTVLPKIVLNPCMLPTVELPKLEPRPGHPEDVRPSAEMVETYRPYEAHIFDPTYNQSRRVIGLFGEDDELLGTQYMQPFAKCYGEACTMPGGHHGNAQAVPTIVRTVLATME